jgi:Polysaccharide pyruvyl transferase
LLKQLVPDGPPIKMVGDDALGLLCEDSTVARKRLAEIGVPLDRPWLGFQAREALYVGRSREDLRETARQVDEFAAAHGYVVVCVATNSQSAAPETELLVELAFGTRRRAEWHVVDAAGDAAVTAGIIKTCSAFLTHSYHTAVFALENRIPTLLFARSDYYQLKAEALRAAFGTPVPISAPQGGAFGDLLERVARTSWSRGMSSEEVDDWLDKVLSSRAGSMSVTRGEWAA